MTLQYTFQVSDLFKSIYIMKEKYTWWLMSMVFLVELHVTRGWNVNHITLLLGASRNNKQELKCARSTYSTCQWSGAAMMTATRNCSKQGRPAMIGDVDFNLHARGDYVQKRALIIFIKLLLSPAYLKPTWSSDHHPAAWPHHAWPFG